MYFAKNNTVYYIDMYSHEVKPQNYRQKNIPILEINLNKQWDETSLYQRAVR